MSHSKKSKNQKKNTQGNRKECHTNIVLKLFHWKSSENSFQHLCKFSHNNKTFHIFNGCIFHLTTHYLQYINLSYVSLEFTYIIRMNINHNVRCHLIHTKGHIARRVDQVTADQGMRVHRVRGQRPEHHDLTQCTTQTYHLIKSEGSSLVSKKRNWTIV